MNSLPSYRARFRRWINQVRVALRGHNRRQNNLCANSRAGIVAAELIENAIKEHDKEKTLAGQEVTM